MGSAEDKLIELHEKLEAKDKALDELKEKMEKQSTWWKNPAMITALIGMLAGVGTTAENMFNRYLTATKGGEEKKVEVQTHNAAYKLLLKRQEEMEEIYLTYAQIFVEALSPVQRRQIKRRIEELELPDLGVDTHAPTEARPAPAAGSIGSAGEVPPNLPAPPEPAEDNIFEQIQRQVQSGGDLEALEEQLSPRKFKK